MTDTAVHRALEKLARSRWGQQGTGAVSEPMTRLALLTRQLARPLRGQPEHVLALTLAGWRALEEHRQKRVLKCVIAHAKVGPIAGGTRVKKAA